MVEMAMMQEIVFIKPQMVVFLLLVILSPPWIDKDVASIHCKRKKGK